MIHSAISNPVRVANGLGIAWALAVCLVAMPMMKGQTFLTGGKLFFLIYAPILAAWIGAITGWQVYVRSAWLYAHGTWRLLIWTPLTLVLAGAAFVLMWGMVTGGTLPFYAYLIVANARQEELSFVLQSPWTYSLLLASFLTHLLMQSVHQRAAAIAIARRNPTQL